MVIEDLKLVSFDITNFFYIQTAEDSQVHKPDPKVFEPILNVLKTKNIKPSEVLYIGDAPKDFLAATGAGIQFVGMAHNKESVKNFKKLKTEHIGSFEELVELVEN